MVRAAGAQGRFITRRSGGRVHVIEAGDGPPVLHLHGNNTSSLSHLMLIDHLTSVQVLPRRPTGLRSQRSRRLPPQAVPPVRGRFVDEVLDELEVDAAVLVGASGGGSWATWYTLDRPARVRGLVLLGSVPLLPGARIRLGIRLMATPGLGDVLRRVVRPNRRMLLGLMSTMGEGETILRHPDLLDSLVDAARDPVATAANVAELQALLSPFHPRSAGSGRTSFVGIDRPTLMIWGDRDPVVSMTAARAVAELITDVRLEVLPAGHVPQLGHPRRVAELLVEFTHSVR